MKKTHMYVKSGVSRWFKLLVTVALTTLYGCAQQPSNEQSGQVVGGVLGGVLGSQVGKGSGRTAATIVGTIIGAVIGGNVGRTMDEVDRMKTAKTLESNRDYQASTWKNPNTGNNYTTVPTRTYESAQGPCREYTVEAIIGGKKEQVYATACRQQDGSWKNI